MSAYVELSEYTKWIREIIEALASEKVVSYGCNKLCSLEQIGIT
jgi:hypothetical protein